MVKENFIVTPGEVKGLLHEHRQFLQQLLRQAVYELLWS
ncbi:hypothetical protein HNQ81_000411 [Desulfoprunum benzoelyticum]|uniref:Uncharacterized protein n=1 Tax=Desulfoprunum benzoelyticum TaxID=1506996 RepID=A0A840UTJ8_9BACT|nr:hypothetical protein [Desulfoprunum benzoelyticum]